MGTFLLVNVEPELVEGVRLAANSPPGATVQQASTRSAALDRLRSHGFEGPVAVVLGTSETDPLAVARQAFSIRSDLAFWILCQPGDRDRLQSAVDRTPRLAAGTHCLSSAEPELLLHEVRRWLTTMPAGGQGHSGMTAEGRREHPAQPPCESTGPRPSLAVCDRDIRVVEGHGDTLANTGNSSSESLFRQAQQLARTNSELEQEVADWKRKEKELREKQRFLEQLVIAHERDRQLMAYDIHDGFIQDLTAALMHLEASQQTRGEGVNTQREQAFRLLRTALQEARRLISGLRPPILDEQGIVAAIDYLIDEHTESGGPPVEFTHRMDVDRLSPLLEGALFSITQEALRNVRQHSQADMAHVVLQQITDRIHLEIVDEGKGFDTHVARESRFGLQGIRARAKTVGGKAKIESEAGRGTKVAIDVPVLDALEREASQRKRAEQALRKAHDELEKRVQMRTTELASANQQLQREIADRGQIEAVLRGRNKVLERLATGAPFKDILRLLVESVEAVMPDIIGSVLLLDPDTRCLQHGAAPHLPDAYNQAVDGLKIGPGVGCCGTSAYTGERVIVEDVMEHPYWERFRDLASDAGFRACWSEPIASSTGKILGTFAMYYRQPRGPSASELELITTAAHLAGIAIESKQADDTLRRARDDLETRVHERTVELQAANSKLRQEIAARQQTNRALEESEERFRQLAESIEEVFWITTGAGRVQYVSPAYDTVFGQSSEQLYQDNTSMLNLVHPDDREQLHLAFFQKSSGKSDVQYRIVRPDGSIRWVRDRGFPIHNDAGDVYRIVGITEDITEQKQIEMRCESQAQELARSDLELRQLAYLVSYDFSKPVRAVTDFCKLLKMKHMDSLAPEAEEALARAARASAWLQEAFRGLSAYSWAGSSKYAAEWVDCRAVLDEALKRIQPLITVSRATITYDQMPTVMADTNQLVDLFEQLIGNAIKFRRSAPPEIHVSVQAQGDHWQFSVQDNGIGIPEGKCKRVFALFYRLPPRGANTGSGVGLAICKKIVQRAGGNIWVESEVGKGSTFYFTIPDKGGNANWK